MATVGVKGLTQYNTAQIRPPRLGRTNHQRRRFTASD